MIVFISSKVERSSCTTKTGERKAILCRHSCTSISLKKKLEVFIKQPPKQKEPFFRPSKLFFPSICFYLWFNLFNLNYWDLLIAQRGYKKFLFQVEFLITQVKKKKRKTKLLLHCVHLQKQL